MRPALEVSRWREERLDHGLVEAARRGDADAFHQLVRPRLDDAYRLALGITGSESDARDATQDAFVTAWRKLHQLREDDRFDAWFRRILVNSCRMQIRRSSRLGRREVRLAAAHEEIPGTPGRSDDEAALLEAVARLPLEQREAVVLHYLEDRPVDEVAATLGIPTGTVKSRLFNGRRALRNVLEPQGAGANR